MFLMIAEIIKMKLMLGAGFDGGQSSLTPVGRSHRVSSKLSHNQFKMNRLVIKKIMDCWAQYYK